MKQKKRGIFERLLDFWREVIGREDTEGIGFQCDREHNEKYFSEMGAVSALSQGEMKKTFWEEPVWKSNEKNEQKKEFFAMERMFRGEGQEMLTGKNGQKVFPVEESIEKKKVAYAEEAAKERDFFADVKAEELPEQKGLSVIEDEGKEKKEKIRENQETLYSEVYREKKSRAETAIDIEKIMQEMEKRLWEERESCGRRLRGRRDD